MKRLLFGIVLLSAATTVQAQKKVAAEINLTQANRDSVAIQKGKSFVVMLPVHNRNGDDWKLAAPSTKCNFTESMLGQAGMLPNQPEPKLMFFKAVEKGVDSIKFLYKNPRAEAEAKAEEKVLIVSIQ
jgi:predicted secreted protein